MGVSMENNEKKFVTDLSQGHNDIIILQPAITAGMRKFEDLWRILSRASDSPEQKLGSYEKDRKVFEAIHNITDMGWFIHNGNLKTSPAGLVGARQVTESCKYTYCGGFCEATTTNINYHERVEWYCENCQTSIGTYHLNPAEVPTILLHLLIKQMVPKLCTGNYIWTEETGVVGVLYDVLTYKPDSQKFHGAWRASLGFTFMPEMHTLTTPNGFEEWLRYLMQIKFDQLRHLAESQRPHLIGPPHSGEQAGKLRFWRG
jgi:hypothetical protein